MTLALSQYNASRPSAQVKTPIVLNDCTLREGLQGIGVSLSEGLAVRLAHQLARAGVKYVQIGMPGRSEADRLAVEAVRAEGLPIKIEALAAVYGDTWREEVDRAAASGVDFLQLFHAASDRRLQSIGMTRDAMLTRAVESIQHARLLGASVVFTPTDTTRVAPTFLIELAKALQQAGAARIGIADTSGCADPTGMRTVTALVGSAVSIPLQVHCHNDLGLALANTLAAVEAGATVVDVTVLGLGERAGNAAIDEVAVALEFLYGINTGITLERLTALSQAVADALGVQIPAMKPFVGSGAFRHHFGIHTHDPEAFEPLSPERVGNTRQLGSPS
jgi:2-isopropylmalate synthase